MDDWLGIKLGSFVVRLDGESNVINNGLLLSETITCCAVWKALAFRWEPKWGFQVSTSRILSTFSLSACTYLSDEASRLLFHTLSSIHRSNHPDEARRLLSRLVVFLTFEFEPHLWILKQNNMIIVHVQYNLYEFKFYADIEVNTFSKEGPSNLLL